MYDVLGDSQGNTGLSRGVCGALCLGIRCWGFPGEYLSDWWYAGALFLGERSCFRGFYDNFLSLFICNLQSHFINKLNLIIELRLQLASHNLAAISISISISISMFIGSAFVYAKSHIIQIIFK